MKSTIIAHITGRARAEYIANALSAQYNIMGITASIRKSLYTRDVNDTVADFQIVALCRASQISMLKSFIVGFIAGQDWQEYRIEKI